MSPYGRPRLDADRVAHTIAAVKSETAALRSLADSIPTALIWVSRNGALLGANRVAHDLAQGLRVFSLRNGLLKWRNRRHGTAVSDCIAAALASKPATAVLNVRDRPRVMISARVVVLPPAPMVPPEHCIALQLVPLSDPGPLPVPALQTLFGLTPSEARLAHALAARRNLSDAAHDVGVTVTTARSYLKQIFLKTATSRQAQLVRLFWSRGGLPS